MIKLTPITFSVFFGFCCLLLNGCATKRLPTLEEEARASLAVEDAVQRFGTSKDAGAQNYIRYLGLRLSAGLARVGRSCNDCDITLLDTSEPLAYSPGSGHMIISKGMIARMHNEAELAFVLAHEMAHQVLGHHANIVSNLGKASPEDRERVEKEADRFAIGMLAISGYDPRYAPTALLHAYGRVTPNGEMQEYPELYTRGRLLQEAVEDSRWSPPGTVDRREFQKLRQSFNLSRRNVSRRDY